MSAEETFDRLVAEHRGQPGVGFGRMFSRDGLTVHGKLFAMLVRDRLVVKVPAKQAAALVSAGTAVPFEPSAGRVMKEWVCVDLPADPGLWRQLMIDARRYVGRLS
jgi:TfoX/Sxy family transcriptional regulator of competence genes